MPFDLQSWRSSKNKSGFDINLWRVGKEKGEFPHEFPGSMKTTPIDIGGIPAEPSTTALPREGPTPQLTGAVGFLQRFVQGAERFPEEMARVPNALAERLKQLSMGEEGALPAQKPLHYLTGEMATGMAKDVYERFAPHKLLRTAGRTWQDPFGTLLYATPGSIATGVGTGIVAGKALRGGIGAALRKGVAATAEGMPRNLGELATQLRATPRFKVIEAGRELRGSLKRIFGETESFHEGIERSGLGAKKLYRKMGDVWEGDIAEGIWELRRFKKKFKEALPHEGWRKTAYRWMDDQRLALKENRPNIFEKDFQMLPDEAKEATRVAREILDDVFQIEEAAGVAGKYKELYAPHWWKTEVPMTKTARGLWRKKSPHAKEQKLESVQEGIKTGLEPRSTDLADVLEWRVKNAIKISSNKRMVENARKAIDPETGSPLVVNATEAHAQGVSHWPRVEAKGLHRKPYILEALHVHPEIEGAVKTMFGDRSGAFRAALEVNAFAKKTLLAASLFHWHALTESAIAMGAKGQIVPGFKEAGMALFGKESKVLPRGLRMIAEGDPHLRMLIRGGLKLGITEDVGTYRIISRAMESLERRGPLVSKPAKFVKGTLGKVEERWDAALWDVYHTNFKAYAGVELYRRLLKKHPKAPTSQLAEEAARQTNFAFGGLNWRRLNVEPKFREALQLTFLAPDWTISNMGVATGMFRGGPARAAYLKYWVGASAYFLTFTELLNYGFTKIKDGEGHFTWDNPPGHEFDIELPYRAPDAQGRVGNRYLRIGKQFKEPFRLLWDIKKIATDESAGLIPDIVKSKLGIIPRWSYEQATGKTMHGYPWLRGSKYQPREMHAPEEIGRRVLHAAEEGLPIPAGYLLDALRGKDVPSAAISAAGFPVSKGPSAYKIREAIARAQIAGDREKEKNLWKIAADNNLGITRSSVKALRTLLQK